MSEVEKRAAAAVEAAFADVLGSRASARLERDGPRIDLVVNATRVTLSTIWAGEGFPADVETALRSARMADALSSGTTPLVVARRMSPGAVTILEERGVSWADESGRASVHAEPGVAIVVDRERQPPPGRARPRSGVRWAPATAAVAETILVGALHRHSEDDALPSVTNLATDAGVSTALASRALQAFDAESWTAKAGAARGPRATRALSDPTAMLSSWASWHADQAPPRISAHALVDDPDQYLAERLAPAWNADDWALTGWMALQHQAPFLTSVPLISVYLRSTVFDDGEALNHLLKTAGLRRVERGARVEILRADDLALRCAEPDDAVDEAGRATPGTSPQRVSAIRLYGDLLRMGARGPDAAEHLRQTRINF